MAECLECGRPVVPGETFCSNCGTQNPAVRPPLRRNRLKLRRDDEAEGPAIGALRPPFLLHRLTPPAPLKTKAKPQPELGSESLGGASTGEVQVQVKHTVKKGTTGGHQPTIKQLDPGSVLNGRYEIVRRIGGGGMGAVYLAKDRNLGDAPRAVKEMVEAHLDPALHEKSIADFKREAVLLTALEHPSIPTIYDYFYDETLRPFLSRDAIYLRRRPGLAVALSTRREN